jgi:hypothetical protein
MRTHAQSPKSTATVGPGDAGEAPRPGTRRRAVPGAPLDDATRAFMEPLLGHDFARVRVHTDDHAADATGAIGARAYTIGHDLVSSPGQYAPGSAKGRRLLAHELAHAAQQPAARGVPGPVIERHMT